MPVEMTVDLARKILLTCDGRGVKAKEEALTFLLEQPKSLPFGDGITLTTAHNADFIVAFRKLEGLDWSCSLLKARLGKPIKNKVVSITDTVDQLLYDYNEVVSPIEVEE